VFADTSAVTVIAKIVVTCVRIAMVFLLRLSHYMPRANVRAHQRRQNLKRREKQDSA